MPISIPSIDIPNAIQKLERRDLDDKLAPDSPPIWGQLENVPFIRVKGLASFWKDDPSSNYEQRMDDLLSSAYGQGLEFLYLLVGQPRDVAVFIGMAGRDAEIILRASLTAAFPGIILEEKAEISLGKILQSAGMFAHRGRLTGIPTRKGAAPARAASQPKENSQKKDVQPSMLAGNQIERICRGMAGEGWGLLVHGVPYPLSQITNDAYTCLDAIAAAASQTKRQVQQLNQTMTQQDPRTQSGSTESISGEVVNRQAEYAVMLLERQLQRLDEAKAVGMWEAEVHFFAPKQENLARAQSLVRAVFAGSDSVPQPLRVVLCGRTSNHANDFKTRLTSVELGTLSQLSREEMPGFRIADYARFDTDFESSAIANPVDIGAILDGNRKTGQAFAMPAGDFAKHGLIAGMTGSGKTTTVFGILHNLWKGGSGGIPFLVVESAKAEYRRLRGSSAKPGPIPDLRVYTLGDETVAPFRINPFEFEVADADHRVHVQTHIDYLKSVFNAAFILYAPMPYVLETCLHEIYTDLGWDLATGLNRRLPKHLMSQIDQWPVFPTLSDLYQKVDEVTERLGYEDRIEMDVKAGLKARIGSLRLGSKGLMLDTQHGVSIKELLSIPTILELERIGNDDEKAFVIGLIMTRIYEYRRVQSTFNAALPDIQHLIVIEEAHRLLKNIKTEVETESANTRGQAVEAFTNMLAEIRAYGQGVLIAEQIPTKLAPDAVKNTNLKIIHRMVAADDREVLAQATNMDQAQSRFVGTLPPGRAAVFSEQADHPLLIEALDYKSKRLSAYVADKDIIAGMSTLTSRSYYEPFVDYRKHIGSGTPQVDVIVYDGALNLINRDEFPELWAALMITLVRDPAEGKRALEPIATLVSSLTGTNDSANNQKIIKSVMLFASGRTLYQRARSFNWEYPLVEEMRKALSSGLIALVDGNDTDAANYLGQFVKKYCSASQVSDGPFPGCEYCSIRCWIRHDAAIIAHENTLKRDIVQTINQPANPASLKSDLIAIAMQAAQRLTGDSAPDPAKRSVALCIFSQAVHQIGWAASTQRRVIGYLVEND
jgi:hypothetical protein